MNQILSWLYKYVGVEMAKILFSKLMDIYYSYTDKKKKEAQDLAADEYKKEVEKGAQEDSTTRRKKFSDAINSVDN